MKHGHLAMIDEKFPTIALAPSDSVYEKNMSNIQDTTSRTDGNDEIRSTVNDVLHSRDYRDALTDTSVVPLHLFAYHFAKQGASMSTARAILPNR